MIEARIEELDDLPVVNELLLCYFFNYDVFNVYPL